ncbi:hypothetical protein Aperf_G00000107030 [Anoplocephala perfoliata]
MLLALICQQFLLRLSDHLRHIVIIVVGRSQDEMSNPNISVLSLSTEIINIIPDSRSLKSTLKFVNDTMWDAKEIFRLLATSLAHLKLRNRPALYRVCTASKSKKPSEISSGSSDWD